MSEFVSRSKVKAIKFALAKLASEQVQAAIPGMAEELTAAAQMAV